MQIYPKIRVEDEVSYCLSKAFSVGKSKGFVVWNL